MFRRFRRPGPARQISPAELSLIKARRFLKNGKFAQAGTIFSGLAREAEYLERRKVAAELHSRAAHCFVDGGAEQTGLSEAQAALRVFTNLGMEERRRTLFEQYYPQARNARDDCRGGFAAGRVWPGREPASRSGGALAQPAPADALPAVRRTDAYR